LQEVQALAIISCMQYTIRNVSAELDRALKQHQWFLSQDGVTTLGVDASVSHRYAEIHRTLKGLGRPIPTNDLWIASIAVEHGLVVYTRDSHFQKVPGLACL
jgi:predicted nucleic acid-binding protein